MVKAACLLASVNNPGRVPTIAEQLDPVNWETPRNHIRRTFELARNYLDRALVKFPASPEEPLLLVGLCPGTKYLDPHPHYWIVHPKASLQIKYLPER